jgi:hypothetical protein
MLKMKENDSFLYFVSGFRVSRKQETITMIIVSFLNLDF